MGKELAGFKNVGLDFPIGGVIIASGEFVAVKDFEVGEGEQAIRRDEGGIGATRAEIERLLEVFPEFLEPVFASAADELKAEKKPSKASAGVDHGD